MIPNMIGGDQAIPGAGPQGVGEGFTVDKEALLLDPEAVAKADPVQPKTGDGLDVIGGIHERRKDLDKKQIEDAFKVLEDLTASPPGWRDIYEAQKARKASEGTRFESNAGRVAERSALDEKQILDAIQVFEDVGFAPNWHDIYEAQKKGATGKSSPFAKVDEILDLTKPVGGPAVRPGWRDQIPSVPKATK